MADDPFDTLKPVRAIGAAPGAEDPFEGLDPQVPEHLLRPKIPHIRHGITNLLYGAAETLAGPAQFLAEQAGLEKGFERNVMGPLRERYYASDAPQDPLAEPMREIGRVVPWLAVRRIPGTGVFSRIPRAVPILGRPGVQNILRDAATGGVVGGLSYVPEGESRAEQAATGALAAVAGGLAIRGLIGSAVRLRNALEGRFAPEAREVMEMSKRYGVDLSAVDVERMRMPHYYARAIRAEKDPLTGVPEFRRRQAMQVNRAAQLLKQRYSGDFMEDWPGAAQASMNQRVERIRALVGAKYDRLARLAEGREGIIPRRAIEEIDELLAKESKSLLPDSALIKELEALRERLAAGPISFERLRDFRSTLGLELKSYYRGENKIIGEKGAALYGRLRRAVDKDMEAWARAQGGDIEAAWRDADRTYRNFARTYRKRQIAALKDVDDPIQLYERFKTLAVRQPTTLYNALGPEGRRAIRYGLVNEAIEQATRNTPTGEMVSAAQLAARLEKLKKSMGIHFGPQESRELDGFIKLMRAAERSGQFMEYPPTGVRSLFTLGHLARGGGLGVAYMIGGWPAVGGLGAFLAASTLKTRVLFTTKAGQRLLLAASHLDPRGEAMRKLVTEQLPKVIAAHVTAEDLIPWKKVDPRELPAELREALYQQPPGVALKDQETGNVYALDSTGVVRLIE